MKKLFVLIPALCFTLNLATAQDPFKLPEITDAAKWQHMAFQANGLMVNTINYAKSLGKTVEEAARFTGEQFKTSWDKEAGFNGFVNGMLYINTCFFPQSTLEIMDQSATAVKFSVDLPAGFMESFPIYSITLEEYLEFWEGIVVIVGDYLGAVYAHELKDHLLTVTIKKK